MDKETERNIALLHAAAGTVFGVISGLFVDWVGLNFLGALTLGFLASYPLMFISRKLFRLELEIKEWLAKGFFIFFVVWLVVWTFFHTAFGT